MREAIKIDRREWNHLAFLGQKTIAERIQAVLKPKQVPHIASIAWFDLFSWGKTWKSSYKHAHLEPAYKDIGSEAKRFFAAATMAAVDNNPLEALAKPLTFSIPIETSPFYLHDDVEIVKCLVAIGYTPYRAVGRMLGEAHSVPAPYLRLHRRDAANQSW